MKIAKQEKKLLNPKNNHEKIKETISETQVLKSELEKNVEKVQQVYMYHDIVDFNSDKGGI